MLYVPKHVNRVVECHQEVVNLIWSFVVSHDHVEDEREQRPDPVDESAPGGLLNDLLPVCHNFKPLAEVLDLRKLLGIEHLLSHQIEAVVDNCGSHEVVATLMALINGGKKVHHILKELTTSVPLAYLIDSFDNDLINNLTRVSVDKDDPLIDHVPFLSKLDLNRLKHLNTSYNIVDSGLSGLLTTVLVHQDQVFDVSLDLSCHV